ncbi:MAG: hypothetical protein WAU70_00915 [Flavobacteriales bacterium]
MSYVRYIVAAIVLLIAADTQAQDADSSAMKSLIVYGDGFSFGVKEPQGWTGDIDRAAEYHSNIVFYPVGEDPDKAALVQVSAFQKQDEKTQNDLAFDVKSYEQQHASLKKEDLAASHKEYRVFAKLVFVKDEFFQYIAYVNPGQKFGKGFSVAMNVQKRRATDEELKAFLETITSLRMIGCK